jgi:hypothetical protein
MLIPPLTDAELREAETTDRRRAATLPELRDHRSQRV